MVLVGLKDPPFEPLERTDLKHVSLKTMLTLALALAKQVGDIHWELQHPIVRHRANMRKENIRLFA